MSAHLLKMELFLGFENEADLLSAFQHLIVKYDVDIVMYNIIRLIMLIYVTVQNV